MFINTDYNKIIANDRITPLINFYNEIKNLDYNTLRNNIEPYILDKTDKSAFIKSREIFNSNGANNPYHFYCLLQSCTNNMMRFNKQFLFNQTFGERTFNKNTEEKLLKYHTKISEIKNDIKFTNENYIDLLDKLINTIKHPNKVFIYIDPPYFNTEAGYNSFWSKELEEKLYDYINILHSKGFKFALSGCSLHKGNTNLYMDKLLSYKIIDIVYDYKKVSRSNNIDTKEMLVINY